MECVKAYNMLNIYYGEMKADIDNEYGSFDEMCYNAFNLALNCNCLLDNSSNGILLQFDKSVRLRNEETPRHSYVWLDAIFRNINDNKDILVSASSEYSEDIYSLQISQIDRFYLLKMLAEIIKMLEVR